MDELDVRIFRSLLKGPSVYSPHEDIRKPLLTVARELRVDEGTVRRRLSNLQRKGFLKGWYVLINPVVVGKYDVRLRFEVLPPSSKEDVMRKLRLVDGVYIIRNYFGNTLAVDMICDDDWSLSKTIELISRISNADTMVRAVESPRSNVFGFDEDDLKIVESIHDNPRKPFSQIAKETSLSVKKVKRRLQRMIEGHALLVTRSLNYRALSGMIKGDLLVFYDAPRSKSATDDRLLRLLGERALVLYLGSADYAAFILMLDNISERNEILGAVKQIKGVEKAYLDLTEENIEVYETFRQQLQRMMAQVKILKESA